MKWYKQIPIPLLALGLYQLFGGMMGLVLILRQLPKLQLGGEAIVLSLIAILLYLLSAVSGIMLLQQRKQGLRLSLLCQALQVISMTVGSFAYTYVAGIRLGLGIELAPVWKLKLLLSLPSFQISFNAIGGRDFVGINLLALLLVYLIERQLNRIQAKN